MEAAVELVLFTCCIDRDEKIQGSALAPIFEGNDQSGG